MFVVVRSGSKLSLFCQKRLKNFLPKRHWFNDAVKNYNELCQQCVVEAIFDLRGCSTALSESLFSNRLVTNCHLCQNLWESETDIYWNFQILKIRNFTNVIFMISYHYLSKYFQWFLNQENSSFINVLFRITLFYFKNLLNSPINSDFGRCQLPIDLTIEARYPKHIWQSVVCSFL